MAKLVLSMITSLDGYAKTGEGDLGTGADDPEVHTCINDLFRPIGTYLYGRRMYETMLYWETTHTEPNLPPFILQYANDWQSAEKIVYSTTLDSVRAPRPGSNGPSTRPQWRSSRPTLNTTSPSTARTSPAKQSQPAWSTSTTCSSSPPASSATELASFPTGRGSISNSSTSEPSTAD